MSFFEKPLRFGTSGKLYQNLSDPGSMLFGGAGVSNSLGQKRDGTKGGLFGDAGKGIDWFGSPVTAGTDSQGTARLAAILYGAAAGAGALAGGSAGGTVGGAAGGSIGGEVGAGVGGGGAAAGGSAGATAGGYGMEGGASAGGSSTPSWLKWAKLGQAGMSGMGGGQKQAYQPQWTDIDDGAQRDLLARLLMEQR